MLFMEQEKIYAYSLQGIDVVEKQLFRISANDSELYTFRVRTQSAVDAEKKLVIVGVEVIIRKVNGENILARFLVAFGFLVPEFDTAIKLNDAKLYVVPNNLEQVLKSISISTMRGIVFSELRGTALHGAIMPVVPLDSLQPDGSDMFAELRETNIKAEKAPIKKRKAI